MNNKGIIALDQGTTSSRSLFFNSEMHPEKISQSEFPLYYPKPGWVEQEPIEIWNSQKSTLNALALKHKITSQQVAGIGITNQRETVVAWDKRSGEPLYRAIVWQCRRTEAFCNQLKKQGKASLLLRKTGLVIDPYFSASKMAWLLQNVAAVKKAAKSKHLAFGTVDSWLIYFLTKGAVHATDVSNASRTQLMNLSTLEWDAELCQLFGIPMETLPEIKASDAYFGDIAEGPFRGVPIHGIAGDQQASLFGHGCLKKGNVKCTYGTGAFLLQNIGDTFKKPPKGLLTTVAWKVAGKVNYAFEGAILSAGSSIQFLRDQLGIIQQASECEELALSLTNNEGVYCVPAFAGLGTPYWDSSARALFIGMTRGTTRAHLCRAALEAMAYQVSDLVQCFSNTKPGIIKADGGVSQNRFAMQFQADILNAEVQVPINPEVTALGAALLAAQGLGLSDFKIRSSKNSPRSNLSSMQLPYHSFKPKMKKDERRSFIKQWSKAVQRSLKWAE